MDVGILVQKFIQDIRDESKCYSWRALTYFCVSQFLDEILDSYEFKTRWSLVHPHRGVTPSLAVFPVDLVRACQHALQPARG